MRKLVFQEFISLDGYAADKEHSTKFFEDPVYRDTDADLLKEMERFDTILLGANTYKMFAGFWPGADPEEQIVADKINSIPKIIFSATLKEAPWGKWQPAVVVKTDAAEKIKQLKSSEGKDMVLWGSISLSQYLAEGDLIDEYHIRVVPVILGDGIALFKKGSRQDLLLVKSKSYPSGLVLMEYKPGVPSIPDAAK